MSAPEIEGIIEDTLRRTLEEQDASTETVWDRIERIVVGAKYILVTFNSTGADGTPVETIDIPRTSKQSDHGNTSTLPPDREPNQKLLQSVVRAHAGLSDLADNRFLPSRNWQATLTFIPSGAPGTEAGVPVSRCRYIHNGGRSYIRAGGLAKCLRHEAHVIGDKAEQAYRRGDALEKQRKLMGAWAAYCEPKAATNVVPIRKPKSH